jgi:hypothetical protein
MGRFAAFAGGGFHESGEYPAFDGFVMAAETGPSASQAQNRRASAAMRETRPEIRAER